MSRQLSRQEFLKLSALGSILSSGAIIAGKILPSTFTTDQNRNINWIATTCNGCVSGCGILVEKYSGMLRHVISNPNHPRKAMVNCEHISCVLDQLYSTRRLPGPLYRANRTDEKLSNMKWENAEIILSEILKKYAPKELGFLLGMYPDHLFDIVQMISSALGNFPILRFDKNTLINGRIVLQDATQLLYGMNTIPYFDTQNTQIIFSFGLNYEEPWVSEAINPKAKIIHFGKEMPKGIGYIDQFFPLKSSDALSFMRLFAEFVISFPDQSSKKRQEEILGKYYPLIHDSLGFDVEEFLELVKLYSSASSKVIIPGATFLSHHDGFEIAKIILALNINPKPKKPSIYLIPPFLFREMGAYRGNSISEVNALLEKVINKRVKVLFIHSVDLFSDLPENSLVQKAFESAEKIISFSTIEDATSCRADFLFPDHSILESWGYQWIISGCDRPAISAIQPVLSPRMNTFSTTNLLLNALSRSGLSFQYNNEIDFLSSKIMRFKRQMGISTAVNPDIFWKSWLDRGGWWAQDRVLLPVVPQKAVEKILSPLTDL
jgi:anaerobic selenocysteine-containing dehydrogenase